jgi:hypothetical protein
LFNFFLFYFMLNHEKTRANLSAGWHCHWVHANSVSLHWNC